MIRILSPRSGKGHLERGERDFERKGAHEAVDCLEARDHAMVRQPNRKKQNKEMTSRLSVRGIPSRLVE